MIAVAFLRSLLVGAVCIGLGFIAYQATEQWRPAEVRMGSGSHGLMWWGSAALFAAVAVALTHASAAAALGVGDVSRLAAWAVCAAGCALVTSLVIVWLSRSGHEWTTHGSPVLCGAVIGMLVSAAYTSQLPEPADEYAVAEPDSERTWLG